MVSTGDNQRALLIVESITLGSSFITCLYIILFYLVCKEIQNFATRLIVLLCVSTLGNITTILISFIFKDISDIPGLCTSTAFFENYFALSAIFWALTISYIFYYQLKEQKDIYTLNKGHKALIYVIPILLPVIFSIIPVCVNGYGKQEFNSTGYYCWIKMYENEDLQEGLLVPVIIQIVSYYGPYILAIVINLYLNMIVYKIPSESQIWTLFGGKKIVLRMLLFPIIIIIVGFIIIIKRIISQFSGQVSDIFIMICLGLTNLQGVLYSICFGGLNQKISETTKKLFSLIFCTICYSFKKKKNKVLSEKFIHDEKDRMVSSLGPKPAAQQSLQKNNLAKSSINIGMQQNQQDDNNRLSSDPLFQQYMNQSQSSVDEDVKQIIMDEDNMI